MDTIVTITGHFLRQLTATLVLKMVVESVIDIFLPWLCESACIRILKVTQLPQNSSLKICPRCITLNYTDICIYSAL